MSNELQKRLSLLKRQDEARYDVLLLGKDFPKAVTDEAIAIAQEAIANGVSHEEAIARAQEYFDAQ